MISDMSNKNNHIRWILCYFSIRDHNQAWSRCSDQ